jgi:transcriptional regulator with XRE-family HTH domain
VEESSWREAFAARLRGLRSGAQLTQLELAERAGLHQQSVWSYEVGRRVPGLYEAVRLAGALGVSLDRLAGSEG